jgi:hypothetical protein
MYEKITSRSVFSLLIVALVLHNLEEAWTICRYPNENPFSFIEPATCRQFLLSVSLITLASIGLFFIAMRTRKQELFLFISTAIAAIFLFNVFLPHVLIAVYTFNYTSGLVTAVTLNLPLSLILLGKNKKSYPNSKLMVTHILKGFAAGYIFFVLVMGFSKLVL